MSDQNSWKKVPLAEIQKPICGLCMVYVDFWWIVDADRNVLIFRKSSPIANRNENLARRFIDNFKSQGAEGVVQMPGAYIKVKASDFA